MQQLTYKGQIVATTAMLAEKLGADENALKLNFNRNKDRYEEGKHYFTLKGKELKLWVTNCNLQISSMTRQLTLWTKKGAFNHVKSLGTDESWDEFEKMSNTYFKMEEVIRQIENSVNPQDILLLEHTKRPVQIDNAKLANHTSFVMGGKDVCIDWNKKVSFSFTGFLPQQLKDYAKRRGVPSKFRTSGKEVIRYYRPAKAAAISLADFLHANGVNDDEAISLAKTALPAVSKILEINNRNQLGN